MSLHEKPRGATSEWRTPPELFARLKVTFDLDVAAPGVVPWIPATDFLTKHEDGTKAAWYGRVWCNPPYGSAAGAFVDRMIEHGNGLLLVASRTEVRWYQRALESADRVCLLRERLHFIREDGHQARAPFGSTIFAWSRECSLALRDADLGWSRPWTAQTVANALRKGGG